MTAYSRRADTWRKSYACAGHAWPYGPSSIRRRSSISYPTRLSGARRTPRACKNAVLMGDPVETRALPPAHQMAERKPFQPSATSIRNDRFITVLDGTWWMGSGTNFDPDNSMPLPAGTFVTHFGKEVHWGRRQNRRTRHS